MTYFLTALKSLKTALKLPLSYLPQRLPVGMTTYDAWVNDIIALSGTYADKTSMIWAISTMVLHAKSDSDRFSKQYFVRRLRKGAANQIASQVIQDIKLEQDVKFEQEKQKAEATTKEGVACPPNTTA